MSARLNMVVDDNVFERFEKGRKELFLSRPKYIEYLLSGRRDNRTKVMKYKELMFEVTKLNTTVKAFVLDSDILSDEDIHLLFERIRGIEDGLKNL